MAQQQQQQQQPPQVDPQLPGPTEEELRDYKLGMERATAQFREQVQVTGRQAYIDLIHTLKKIALCGLRWFKLNVSKYQKDVKLSKRCQMSKNETP